MTNRSVHMHGRIFLSAHIKLITGLHIGGAAGGLEIGGVDKPVIRNPLTNQPYIPGSSLKGKMRSLMEKAHGAPQTFDIKNPDVRIHAAESQEHYDKYPITCVFGSLPQWGPEGKRRAFTLSTPTRLIVRDVPLLETSVRELEQLKTDLPFTEVKWEASIDRVTSAAAPRQIERVPAGAVFGPAELVFSVYSRPDEPAATVAGLFVYVIEALEYLEDDYLGGMGTRGNGRVALTNIQLRARRMVGGRYGDPVAFPLPQEEEKRGLAQIDRDQLRRWLADTFA